MRDSVQRALIDWLKRREECEGLSSVIVVESIRRLIATGEVQISRRYYVSSLPSDSGQWLAELIRNAGSLRLECLSLIS